MSFEAQIQVRMRDYGLPAIPDHFDFNGKVKRFGPQKSCWYVLRNIELRNGRVAVQGAFGQYMGDDNGAEKIWLLPNDATEFDREAYARSQAEIEKSEREERERAARAAANRANQQWQAGTADGVDAHPYLQRKHVPGFGLRVAGGELLIPMISGGGLSGQIKGLQKIDSKGEKRFNKGVDKIGCGFVIGELDAPAFIAIGEGYATCASFHLIEQIPTVVGFDSGNLPHVARLVRAAFPDATLLLLADDDYQLKHRLFKRLREFFGVVTVAEDLVPTCGHPIVIDDTEHTLVAADGTPVLYTAGWRVDGNEVPYLVATVKKGKYVKPLEFKNAGVSTCFEIAAELGNAHVLVPRFRTRVWQKWTDWNDLHVEENFDAVASQINPALAFLRGDAPPPPSEAFNAPSTSFSFFAPAPPAEEQKQDLNSVATQRGEEDKSSGAEAPRESMASDAVAPAAECAKPDFDATAVRSLDWVLANMAQVYGSTSVWDSLNNLMFSHSAFVQMVGKAVAKEWAAHADRKVVKKSDVLHLIDGGKKAEAAPAAPAAGGGGGKGKKADKLGDEFWEKVDRLMNHFVLIYGTDEAWDGEAREFIKVKNLRLAMGGQAVTMWLNNPERRMLPMSAVVFDPSMTCDPATHINLFGGFGMVPKKGQCDLILDLLAHLCGADSDVLTWVIRWLAYPLQHPGAKMSTSLVLHGDEGSGKNLIFELCVAKIYGEYACTIGNAELEDKHNTWASRKQFVLCDEVVTRAELRQLKGRLKAMITGATIRINPKNLNSREEKNCANFVFLSNEIQPLSLDKTDRRYMVIWTPPRLDESFYRDVVNQMFNGGIEAFYDFLLTYDLGDFTPHTKPIMTEAKRNLIGLSAMSPERFFQEWSEGYLPVPYVCCSAAQLFSAYTRWCHLNGERYPPNQTMFGKLMMREAGLAITRTEITYDLMSDVRKRTVYLVGDKPEDISKNKWVENASELFEKALSKYRNVFERTEER